MNSSKRTWLRVAGLCGVVGPLVALSLIAIAIARSPWFSWTANALSDLGAREGSAALFNSGLILGGILVGAFAVGLREFLRSLTINRAVLESWDDKRAHRSIALDNAGGLAFLLAAVALCAIGIFPETAGDIHFYVSFAFFVLVVISLWVTGAALAQLGERGLGASVAIAGTIAAAVWALPWPAVAIPEIIASLGASACSIALGVRLFKRG